MTYARVIPRDLFNEGDLLNCLGRLWIKLDERRDHTALLDYDGDAPFDIRQDPADGSIACWNIALMLFDSVEDRESLTDMRPAWLFRPLNSRSKWPLWCRIGDEDVRVFGRTGSLSPEFWVAISQPELFRQRLARRDQR